MNVTDKTVERKSLFFKLAVYSINGTFLGFEDLDKHFMYCGMSNHAAGGPSYNTQWLQFGHGYSESYQCDLRLLLNKPTLFYELYFVDESAADGRTLYPVPIRVLNYRGASGEINRNSASIDQVRAHT